MSTFVRPKPVLFTAAVAALFALTACSTSAAPEASNSSEPSAAAEVVLGDPSALELIEDGVLTVHVDDPVWSPWFIDNDPSNGEGFESALTYAVAEKLGFAEGDVTWGYTAFSASYSPGPKPFDFYVQEVSITEDRKAAVTFSDPYYVSRSVVITKEGSEASAATSIEELSQFTFGTVVATTQDTYISETINPDNVLTFDTVALSTQALENGQVDAIVADLQIAQNVVLNQYDDLQIAGLLKDNGLSEGMGFVFDLNSPLAPYVNAALQELEEEGTIDELVETWLPLPADIEEYTE
ncbi:ABC transporter substrate-binding protein [Humidisolicoccus flavus]|uniref:ABC transporter substrate-binding protein n=1 Tax=Humidisolicoccus flavus TaxID=3111414 RepID=UPI00324D44C2